MIPDISYKCSGCGKRILVGCVESFAGGRPWCKVCAYPYKTDDSLDAQSYAVQAIQQTRPSGKFIIDMTAKFREYMDRHDWGVVSNKFKSHIHSPICLELRAPDDTECVVVTEITESGWMPLVDLYSRLKNNMEENEFKEIPAIGEFKKATFNADKLLACVNLLKGCCDVQVTLRENGTLSLIGLNRGIKIEVFLASLDVSK